MNARHATCYLVVVVFFSLFLSSVDYARSTGGTMIFLPGTTILLRSNYYLYNKKYTSIYFEYIIIRVTHCILDSLTSTTP